MTDDAHRDPDQERSAHISRPPADDDISWMAQLNDLTDADLERLLHGSVPRGADALAPLAQVTSSLRRRAQAEAVPAMSEELRGQLASGPAVVHLAPPGLLRRAGAKSLLGAAAAALFAGLVGVGAASNRLPDEVQNVVSSAAELVGVDVPRADEADDRGRDEDGRTPGGTTPADPGTPGDHEPATPADPPDHSEGGGNPDPGVPPDNSNAGGNPDPGVPPDNSNAGGNPPVVPDQGPPPSSSNAAGNPAAPENDAVTPPAGGGGDERTPPAPSSTEVDEPPESSTDGQSTGRSE